MEDILVLKFKSMIKKIFLVNVYGPNNDNQALRFYDHLIDVLRKEVLAYEDKIIIGGGFNCPMNPLLDRKGGILVLMKKLLNALKKYEQHLICMMYGVLKIPK